MGFIQMRSLLLTLAVLVLPLSPLGSAAELKPELSVKEIMNGIITPATNTIWGAYQLETDARGQKWKMLRSLSLLQQTCL